MNLFIASEVEWPEKGLKIVQETTFPQSDTTTLTLRCKTAVRMPLRIRVPYWATRGGTVKLNGRELESFAEPSSYFVLNRTWQDGDKVELTMPMSLHVNSMPDDSTLQAVMYGPLVLTGRLGTEGLTKEILRASPPKSGRFRNTKASLSPRRSSRSNRKTRAIGSTGPGPLARVPHGRPGAERHACAVLQAAG